MVDIGSVENINPQEFLEWLEEIDDDDETTTKKVIQISLKNIIEQSSQAKDYPPNQNNNFAPTDCFNEKNYYINLFFINVPIRLDNPFYEEEEDEEYIQQMR